MAQVQMQQSFPGEFAWNVTITRSGAYYLSVRLSNDSSTDPAWIMNVRPRASAYQTMIFQGSGLDKAVFVQENSFTIVDRDIFGNGRLSQAAFFHDAEVDEESFPLVVTAKLRQDAASVRLSPDRVCRGVFCINTGSYRVTYWLYPPASCEDSPTPHECVEDLDLELALKIRISSGSTISTSIPVHAVSPFVPGASLMFENADTLSSSLVVNQSYFLSLVPRDGYAVQVPPAKGRIVLETPHGRSVPDIAPQGASSYSMYLTLTVSGQYPLSVLDGGAHIAGSPFQISIVAERPSPDSTRLVGPGAFATFVNATTRVEVQLFDAYGNVADSAKVASLVGFLSHVNGTQNIQALTVQENGSFFLTFRFRLPGVYKLSVSVNGVFVDGDRIITGNLKSPLRSAQLDWSVGSELVGMIEETNAATSVATGSGLTLSTAGEASTFTVTAKDVFGVPRTSGGEVFDISLPENTPAPCFVSEQLSMHTSPGAYTYAVQCEFTQSGDFQLDIKITGVALFGSPVLLTILPGRVSAEHSYLEQVDPVVYFGTVGTEVVSATADVADGAFVRTVGNNTFTLILKDANGNQIQHERAQQNQIQVFVVAQHVRVSNGLVMWNEGEQPVGNLTFGGVVAEGESVVANSSNGTVLAPVSNSISYEEDDFPKWVGLNSDGNYEVSFLATMAGKYRLHVLVNGAPIRRHISIAEMQAEHRGDVASTPSCCLPVSTSDLCPGSGSFSPVCGELLTFLPDLVDVNNTMVVGQQFKQFRGEIDGDGTGNEEFPIFVIRARDRYGNIQTRTNVELVVTVIDTNGTVIHQDPASSLQPSNPLFACRVSDLEATQCGQFEYQWSSITSSRSGMYMIHLGFNGTAAGPDRSYMTIRPWAPETLMSQIFGPGLQINVGGEPSYFYFRVFDAFNNPWEPDSTDDKPVNVDMGLPIAYGLANDEKLYLDTIASTPRTRLIYHGFGLFQVQYMAFRNQTNIRGNFQILYDDKKLAIPGVGRSFVPLTLGAPYEELAPVPLVPVASVSFATGSALYNHYAGDEVEVTVHSLSGYPEQDFPTGYWPAVAEEQGKHWIVEVQGPPGAPTLRIFPARREEFRWQLQATWVPTVSGEYIVSVEYDNQPVQGDPSTPATVMPTSPWTVHVHPAPVDPRATLISGEGTFYAMAGELSTFQIQTRDIFGNHITSAVYNRFQADPFVNASLLAAEGPSVLAHVVTLSDGTFRAEYLLTQSGTYALTVMVNGVTVSSSPRIVEVAAAHPSLSLTRWSLSSSGEEGELCYLSNFNPSLELGLGTGPFEAGQILSVLIELRDALNNFVATGLAAEQVELQLVLDDESSFPSQTVDSRYAGTLAVTRAGNHSMAILLFGSHLSGSPWTFIVTPSDLYGPQCVAVGPGLLPTFLGDEGVIGVLGYDFFGNALSLATANISFSVIADDGSRAPTNVQLAYNATLSYVLRVLGKHTVVIQLWGSDGRWQDVQGSGTNVTALHAPAPLVSSVAFLPSGAGLNVVFDRRTDMACMYGLPHALCEQIPSGPQQACCSLFEEDSCLLFGDARSSVPPLCWWKSPFELAVLFGSGASVGSRQELRFREAIRNQEGTSGRFQGTVQLQPPLPALVPSIVFVAETEIGPCDTMVLDASLSMGGGGRGMRFEWMQFRHSTGSSSIESLPTVVGSPRLKVPATNFTHEPTEIFLEAVNYFGSVGGRAATVHQQANPILRIIPLSAVHGTVHTSRSSTLRLSAQLQHAPCFSIANVTVQWNLAAGQPLPATSVGGNTSHLELAPFSLDANTSYEFNVSATAVLQDQQVTASASVRVDVEMGAIYAVLVGIAGEVPATAELVLDASASVDADRTDTPFRYQWSCEPVIAMIESSFGEEAVTSAHPCFFDISGVLLQDVPLLDLTGLLSSRTYICEECIPGMYKLTVNVSKPHEGRWSTAHLIFRVRASRPGAPLAALIPLDRRAVSTNSRLRFKSVELTGEHQAMEYQWGIASGQDSCCLGPLNMTNASLFPTGLTQDYLILKPGLLLPGITYALQVHTRSRSSLVASTATMFVDVYDWPTGGSFSVHPTVGTATKTTFTLMCMDWTDSAENLPLMFEFGYSSNVTMYHPIGLFVENHVEWTFPTEAQDNVVTVFARVHNRFNPGRILNTSILMHASLPATLTEGLQLAQSRITDEVDLALRRFQVSGVFQQVDIVLSLLNHLGDSNRRTHDSLQLDVISVRSDMESRLRNFAFSMPYDRVTMLALARSLEGLTHNPMQLDISIWLQIVTLCQDLTEHDELIVDNDFAAHALANTLNNILAAARVQSVLHPSTVYLWTARRVWEECWLTLRRLSIAQLSERVPEDENIIQTTPQFVMNSRRIYFETAFQEHFAAFTSLPSQPTVGDDEGLAFRFTSKAIERQKKQYAVRNGPFVFGTRQYPQTVYSEEGHYPKSIRNVTFRNVESRWFDAVPISQRSALRTYYLDIQVLRWQQQPLFAAERLNTELNWGSLALGRVSNFRCSSALTDCSETNNICSSPVVEGSQGPDYEDRSCVHALNVTSVSSWAVNPDAIADPSGAGSTMEVRFVRPFILTMFRYQQRAGPKYCRGSNGVACQNSSATCECVVGGDRQLALNFDDGTQQVVELANSYEQQLFHLRPVTTAAVVMQVLSVYSNPKTCPSRDLCAWWNPTCVDWCPNGAQLIEFLSTEPDALVYDVDLNYMDNYSMAAAVISDLASIEVRQDHQVLELYNTESPILVDLPEKANSFGRNVDTLVVCRTFDHRAGRWSNRGVLHTNEVTALSPNSSVVHSCHAYMVAIFGLVLVENPYEPVYEALAVFSQQGLPQSLPSHFLLLGIALTVIFLYFLAVLWVVRSWLLAWMRAEIESRARFNEYLFNQQAGGSVPVPVREQAEATKPSTMPVYFPVLTLLQSKVVAAQDLLRGVLFRIHLRRSFGKWHYVYALWTGADEVVVFARITCLCCVVLTVLSVSAVLISDDNMTTERWYEASLQIICSIFPLAQMFPALFRLVSLRHETFNRFEDTDVYHGPLVEPQPVYGPQGTEKKTRLKDLKKTLGKDVIYAGLKEDALALAPVSTVSGQSFGDAEASASAHSRPLLSPEQRTLRTAAPGRFLGDAVDAPMAADDGSGLPPITTMGSLKYFVQQRRMKQKQAAALAVKIKANQVTSAELPEEDAGTPTGSGSGVGSGAARSDPESSESGLEGKVAIAPVQTPSMQATEPATISSLSVAVPEHAAVDTPRQGAQLRSGTPSTSPQQDDGDQLDDDKPKPPPRVVEPPPPVPPGEPARVLNHLQERELLRRRRRRELQNEAPIASRARRWVYGALAGQGVEKWSRGTRARDELFFPKQFRWLCYLICLAWAILCLFLLFVYAAAFDAHIAVAWLRLSALSLAIELAVSQTMLAFSQAWWLCYGKVWAVQQVTAWCLARTDILPPMG